MTLLFNQNSLIHSFRNDNRNSKFRIIFSELRPTTLELLGNPMRTTAEPTLLLHRMVIVKELNWKEPSYFLRSSMLVLEDKQDGEGGGEGKVLVRTKR